MVKKKIAPRSGSETADLWERFSDVPEWRSRYDKYRASGMSYARSVEAASRAATSKGAGGAAGTIAPTGKARPPKRAGDKPVVAGGGEKGQGIVKRNDMKGATKKAKTRDQGEFIVKRAWRAAAETTGDTWKTLTYRQKVQLVLKGIPSKINGEVAIGIVRGLTSRATGGRGGGDAAAEIAAWAKDKGVKSPQGEITVAKTAGREGRKMRSRRGGKGSEGVQKPMGKEVKNAVADVVVTRTADTIRRLKSETESRTQELGWREGASDPAVQKRVEELVAADTSNKSEKKKYNRALAAALREAKPGVSQPRSERVPKKAVYKKLTFQVPVGSKKGTNKVGDQITISIIKPKTLNIPTIDGKPIVFTNKIVKGGALTDKVSPKGRRWVKINMSSYAESLTSGGSPSTPDTRQYGKPKKEGLQKPSKREFKGKMESLSEFGRIGNKEFTEDALLDAYKQIWSKAREENKAAKAKLIAEGASPEKIKEFMRGRGAPSVREVAEAIGFEPNTREELALVRRVGKRIKREGIRREIIRRERRPAKPIKGSKKKFLKDTTEQQRKAFLEAEDRRERKRQTPKAEPAKREKVLTETQAKLIGEAAVKGKAIPESAIPSTKEVARIRRVNKMREDAVPKKRVDKPFSIRDAALKDLTDPRDRRAFKTIERLSEKGFTKSQVRDILKGNRNITPAARKVAKGLGMVNIATLALNFLDNLDKKKK